MVCFNPVAHFSFIEFNYSLQYLELNRKKLINMSDRPSSARGLHAQAVAALSRSLQRTDANVSHFNRYQLSSPQ